MVKREFGAFTLVRRLGSGGMAETFVAVRRGPQGFEQRVCLKRIRAELQDDPELITHFLTEARLAASLRHANIAQVLDFGEVEGRYYLALELVEGMDLAALLRAQLTRGYRLDSSLVAYIGVELAAALHVAHSAVTPTGTGILHRDVSPSNVLVSEAGEVKLSDLGIAKTMGQARGTKTGVIKGKVAYMAPEYARTGHFEPRCDLYSLGVLLYECLCGERPYVGDTELAILERAVRGDYVPIVMAAPETPLALARVVEGLISPDPMQRGASSSSVLEALLQASPVGVGLRRELGELVVALRPAVDTAHASSDGDALESPTVVPNPPAVVMAGEPHSLPDRSGGPRRESARPQDRRWLTAGLLAVVMGAVAAWALLFQEAPQTIVAGASEPPSVQGTLLERAALTAATAASAASAEREPVPTAHEPAIQGLPGHDVSAEIADDTDVADDTDAADAKATAGVPDTGDAKATAASTEAAAPGTSGVSTRRRAGASTSATRAARTRARSARPRSTERLSVYVLPYGQVWINGKPQGEAPVEVQLPVGRHLVAAGVGKPTVKQWVVTKQGEATRVALRLDLRSSDSEAR